MEASVVVVVLLVVGWWLLAGPSKAKRDRAREALEIEVQIRAIDGKAAKDIVRELVDKELIAGIRGAKGEIKQLASQAIEELAKGRANKHFRLNDKGLKTIREGLVTKLNRIRERAANGIYDPEP